MGEIEPLTAVQFLPETGVATELVVAAVVAILREAWTVAVTGPWVGSATGP